MFVFLKDSQDTRKPMSGILKNHFLELETKWLSVLNRDVCERKCCICSIIRFGGRELTEVVC